MRAFFCILLLCGSSIAQADTAGARLDRFLDGLGSLTARFDQTLTGEAMLAAQKAQGRLSVQRPGQFRWDYESPQPQLMVADGEKLWFYDPDLEQVTVKPEDEALATSPALLLAGTRPVADLYTRRELGERDGLLWLELLPRAPDSGFQRVSIAFSATTLARMEMQDSFGQITTLHFSEVERNPRLDPALFRFTPPTGVDVVGE